MKWRAFGRTPQWVRLSEWLGRTRRCRNLQLPGGLKDAEVIGNSLHGIERAAHYAQCGDDSNAGIRKRIVQNPQRDSGYQKGGSDCAKTDERALALRNGDFAGA